MWKDISSAPKDGTEIIGCFSCDYGYQTKPTVYGPWTIRWSNNEWQSSWEGSRVIDSQTDFGTQYKSPDIEPTHWTHLPELPAKTKNIADVEAQEAANFEAHFKERGE